MPVRLWSAGDQLKAPVVKGLNKYCYSPHKQPISRKETKGVQKVDSKRWVTLYTTDKHYPMDSAISFPNTFTYPLNPVNSIIHLLNNQDRVVLQYVSNNSDWQVGVLLVYMSTNLRNY